MVVVVGGEHCTVSGIRRCFACEQQRGAGVRRAVQNMTPLPPSPFSRYSRGVARADGSDTDMHSPAGNRMAEARPKVPPRKTLSVPVSAKALGRTSIVAKCELVVSIGGDALVVDDTTCVLPPYRAENECPSAYCGVIRLWPFATASFTSPSSASSLLTGLRSHR